MATPPKPDRARRTQSGSTSRSDGRASGGSSSAPRGGSGGAGSRSGGAPRSGGSASGSRSGGARSDSRGGAAGGSKSGGSTSRSAAPRSGAASRSTGARDARGAAPRSGGSRSSAPRSGGSRDTRDARGAAPRTGARDARGAAPRSAAPRSGGSRDARDTRDSRGSGAPRSGGSREYNPRDTRGAAASRKTPPKNAILSTGEARSFRPKPVERSTRAGAAADRGRAPAPRTGSPRSNAPTARSGGGKVWDKSGDSRPARPRTNRDEGNRPTTRRVDGPPARGRRTDSPPPRTSNRPTTSGRPSEARSYGARPTDNRSISRTNYDRPSTERTPRLAASRDFAPRPPSGRTGAPRGTDRDSAPAKRVWTNREDRPAPRGAGPNWKNPSARDDASSKRLPPKPAGSRPSSGDARPEFHKTTFERVDGPVASTRPASRKREPIALLGEDEVAELATAVGKRRLAPFATLLADARQALIRSDDVTARRMAKQVLAVAPTSTTANEIAGLANYSLGKWADASKHLSSVYTRTQDAAWLAVLMDCARARKRWMEVDQLWNDLRESSPGAEMMAEGRIVYAGSLADRGQLTDAIALLNRSSARRDKRPRAYDIRSWYALADLYERAGDVPKARALFLQVAKIEPEAYDAAERAASLT